MKRFLMLVLLFGSIGVLGFGLRTIDLENKRLDKELGSLRSAQLSKIDLLEKKLAELNGEYTERYGRLEASRPRNAYRSYDCSVHIDTEVLENNNYQVYNASGTLFHSETGELLILTNFHVFQNAVGRFLLSAYARFKTPGAYPQPIELFAWDPVFDLAIAKFKTPPAYDGPIATFGSSDNLRPGEAVIAVGSSGGFPFSCSAGVIQNTNGLTAFNSHPALRVRTPSVILHSAAFGPGNSGGPLITADDGKVVGINYAVMDKGDEGIRMNFYMAIPGDDMARVLPRLLRGGRVEHGWNGWLRFSDTCEIPSNRCPGGARPVREGVIISSGAYDLFDEPRPNAGDVVLALNGAPTPTRILLCRELMDAAPGSVAELDVLRGDKFLKIKLPIVKYEIPP